MPKNLLKYILIIVAGLVIILIVLKIATDSINAPIVEDSAHNQIDTTTQQENDPNTLIPTNPPSDKTTNGVYSDYSAEALSAAQGKKIVLFFYANWCPSCRQQDANLQQKAEQIPSDLAIFKVNYDTETALRQKYGVTLQHTFVQIDAGGKELKQWNTLYSAYDLQSIVDQVS